MDGFFFSKLLATRRHKPEDVGWVEILNYSVSQLVSHTVPIFASAIRLVIGLSG